MNFAEYTQLALRTKAPTYTRDHIMMGLFGEAGEVVDLIKKVVAHGHPVTLELLAKARAEIGDVLWHVAIGAVMDGVDPSREGGDFFFGTATNADLAVIAARLREDVYEIEQGGGDLRSYKDAHITLSILARAFDTTLKQCAIENIEKLRKRYPDGFSSEASQARVDVTKECPRDCCCERCLKEERDGMQLLGRFHRGTPFDEALPVVAKEFVLERTRRGFSDVPWYLYPTQGGSSNLAWTNKEEHAIRFKTADDALKALDGDKRFTREAYVFRVKAVTQ